MKFKKHSIGWYTVENLIKKVKAQRTIIIILTLLWFLTIVFGLSGGR